MFYLFFGLAFALVMGVFLFFKFKFKSKNFENLTNKLLKIFVIIYCGFVFLEIFLPNAFTICYDSEMLNLSTSNKYFAYLRWFSTLAFIMLPLSVFFKNRTIKNIAIYFCTIITIISICNYSTYLEVATSTMGKGLSSVGVFSEGFKAFLINPVFRSFVLGIVWLLELCIPIISAINHKHLFNVKNIKEVAYFMLILPLTLFMCIPIYVPQHLFGFSDIIFSAWSPIHFVWILFVVIELIVLYFVFRNKQSETKYILCLMLAMSLFLHYNQMFGAISIDIKRLPFQLCNIASYLILISLIFKSKKLFNFVVIVNVAGVLFALAMPDLENEGLFYLYNMHFILEHTNILICPILCLMFGVFDRLNKKSLKHCLVGFSIYFVSVLFLGTLFNAIASVTQNGFYSANYLFMFDKEVATSLLPFLASIFDISFSIGKHITFYPVIQLCIYLIFVLLCIVIYYAVRGIYKLKDAKSKK